jgi:hypothetical protein
VPAVIGMYTTLIKQAAGRCLCALALPLFSRSRLVLVGFTACNNSTRSVPPTVAQSQSERSTVSSEVPDVIDIAGTYTGSGHDSVLGNVAVVITFSRTKTLQAKLRGSVTSDGYKLSGFDMCTGTVKGQVNGEELSGLYSALKCKGVVHSGSFGVTKLKKS